MMGRLSSVMICCVYLLFVLIVTLSGRQDWGQPVHVTGVSGQVNNYQEEKEKHSTNDDMEGNILSHDITRSHDLHKGSEYVQEHLPEPNVVKEPSPCSISMQDSELIVDCSRMSLTRLTPSWFPSNTNKLFIEGNYLTTLKNSSFSHLRQLSYLSLRDNKIFSIESKAFEGLYQLQILDLYNNEIDFANDSIPESIFSPLTNLRKLNVVQNTNLRSHGKEFFRPLVNLESLSLNVLGDYMQFGPEFKNLTKLSYLTATGNVQYINDSTFENLASLKELFLDDMGRNMSLISLATVKWSFSKQDIKAYGYLTSADTRYLIPICVRMLVLNDIDIFVIERSAFNDLGLWDKCLEHLQISFNPIIGDFMAFIKVFRLKNLRTIVVSDVTSKCHSHDAASVFYQTNSTEVYGKFRRSSLNNLVGWTKSNLHLSHEKRSLSPGTSAFISPSIRHVTAVRFIMSQSLSDNLRLIGAENVEFFDISDNGFFEFYGIVKGLQSLKILLMAGNDVSKLSESFFDSFPALEHLNLSNCRLDAALMSTHSARYFSKLSVLKSLDMSSNSLHLLSYRTFSVNNTKLQRLILAKNQFREIPFKLSDTPDLSELDLTYNALTWLDKATTQTLDLLASGKNGFALHISGNVLSCGCENLQFLQWMLQTKVRLDRDGNYTCINGDGLLVSTGSFHDLDALWRECVGQMFLAVALILLCIYVIGVLTVFLFLKHKTLIRSTVLQLLGGFKLHTKDDYDIGVYIGYADADYRFPCTYLREYIEGNLQMNTYVSDRDLLPSSYKASAIVNAINSSWRVLLVCSQGFLQDDQWSIFAMRSAIYSQSPANPDRVLVLVHEQCVHQLPTDLLSALSEDRIIVVDKWEMDYKLREKLRTRLIGL
ncbi:hypothetical protein Btru_021452 [Bulinus truncatus]|nr:hypothetical protein Btru_021452 [Bulinus truncatus]